MSRAVPAPDPVTAWTEPFGGWSFDNMTRAGHDWATHGKVRRYSARIRRLCGECERIDAAARRGVDAAPGPVILPPKEVTE